MDCLSVYWLRSARLIIYSYYIIIEKYTDIYLRKLMCESIFIMHSISGGNNGKYFGQQTPNTIRPNIHYTEKLRYKKKSHYTEHITPNNHYTECPLYRKI